MRPEIRRAVAVAIATVAVFALNAGHALGAHVHCGEVITVDTVLDSDLTCSGARAIDIGAAGLTVDLNGHVLTTPRTGILNPGFEDVTIQNGEIRGVDTGILLNDADRNTLRDLFIVRRGGGTEDRDSGPVTLNSSDQTLIKRNALFGWGIALTLMQSHQNLIAGNRTGYFLCGLEGRCDVHATGGRVALAGSNDNILRNNAFSQGPVSVVQGSNRNVIKKNSFSFSITSGLNLTPGLFMGGGTDNVVVHNTAFKNRDDGIIAADGTRTRIEKNVAYDNGRSGILVFEESAAVVHNVAHGNRDSGIHIGRAGTLVKRNRSTDNLDWGIEAVPGVIDGGGNKASNNGTGQCLNVTCK